MVEDEAGPEYLLVNLTPGTTQRVPLPGSRYVSFDGLALRVRVMAWFWRVARSRRDRASWSHRRASREV